MNKRQYKKAFKKKYGYNPVDKKKTVRKAIKEIKTTLELFNKTIRKMPKIISRAIGTLTEQIQTMSDEEFLKKLDELSVEQKNIAWKIRTRGKHK